MNVATEYAKLSSCQRLKVGALLVKDGTPIAIGYNGTKPGQDNCCEGADGKTLPTVRHAEINALNKLWTTNEKATGAALFVTHAPCIECAQDLYHAGVRDYYFRWHYRDDAGLRFLLKNGATIHKVLPDIDAIHRLSLRYNLNTDLEIAYDKITDIKEVNEEAARAAGSVEWDYFEIREAAAVQREIPDEFPEVRPETHCIREDGSSFRKVLEPDWGSILTSTHPLPDLAQELQAAIDRGFEPKGFIPLRSRTADYLKSPWPHPKRHDEPKPADQKPANGGWRDYYV